METDEEEAHVVGVIFRIINSAGEEGSGMVVARATGGHGKVFIRICQVPALTLCQDYSHELTNSTAADGTPEFVVGQGPSQAFLTIEDIPGLGRVDLDFWSTSPPGLFGGPAACGHETVLGGFALGSPLNDVTLAMVVRGGAVGDWQTNGVYCGFMATDGASTIFGL